MPDISGHNDQEKALMMKALQDIDSNPDEAKAILQQLIQMEDAETQEAAPEAPAPSLKQKLMAAQGQPQG